MRLWWLQIFAVAGLALMMAACNHYVEVAPGERAVKVYPDEAAFQKVKSLEAQGGPMGMVGSLGEDVISKQIDDRTPVRILSQDAQGAQIEVTAGPNKGLRGFVAKRNLS